MTLYLAAHRYFCRQLAIYGGYHCDRRNCIAHWLGIPVIFFSVLLVLALCPVPIGEKQISVGSLLLVPATIAWIALDVGVGCAMLTAIVPLALGAEWVARHCGPTWTIALASGGFVIGWLFQIVGHMAFERRKPAFLDDLSQMFIGPMFLAAKALVALGRRRDLADLLSRSAPSPT
jgi:uncharacterized membrane protein YGL010W